MVNRFDTDNRPADEPLPIAEQQAIDAICDRFEREWRDGNSPRLIDFLGDLAGPSRDFLLRELTAIELSYGHAKSGDALNVEQVIARYPELGSDLRHQVAKMATLRMEASSPSSGSDSPPTVATHHWSGSAGLHIRCPHCQVALELLEDSPLDEITCHGCGSNFSLIDHERDTEDRLAPKQVGRFRLLERIGVGGFGSVWKAHDADLDRAVAVKIPRKGQLTATEMEMFFREARAAAQLRHPNIVPVHEVGRDGDTIFIVSDLILGESLANWLKEQTSSMRDMVEMLAKIADALDYAHERGVVHRDFKPSNVMIDGEGAPHLMDFGLAKREVGEVTMTIDGHIVGTPAYMSPEQASGGTHWVDRRTDVYSLGVVLFEVLTGELPFRGNAQMQIRERLNTDAPNPRRLNQRTPVDLATISLKCLEREANRRYSTAREVGEDLRRYLRGEPIAARPLSMAGRFVRWARRNPASAAAATLAAALAVAGPVAAVVINSQREQLAAKLDEIGNLTRTGELRFDEQSRANRQLMAKIDELIGITAAGSNAEMNEFLAEDLAQTRFNEVHSTIDAEATPLPIKARGHLAMAYLLARLNERDRADGETRLAIAKLKQLEADEPDNLTWAAGLSECYGLLGVLNSDSPDVAARDSELAGAALANVKQAKKLIDDATANLDVTKLTALHDLSPNWPMDPTEIYELACYLTDHPPVLLDADSAAAKGPSD